MAVLRLNIHDAAAQQTLQQLGFRFTPTFVLLDPEGNEVWRSIGSIDATAVRAEVAHLEPVE